MSATPTEPSGETARTQITASFEFFPPNGEKANETLWQTVRRLAPLGPSFVSVTYGAGGSTRERTRKLVERILRETTLEPAAHLTCVGAAKSEVDEIIEDYRELGVRRLVALRGDPTSGIGTAYRPHPDGYAYAADLVAGIKRIADFDVSVSGYPERHPESANWQSEIDNLKRKVDAGADRIITQYFFDNDLFEDYLNRIVAAGIRIPVIPGIMPIRNFEQTKAFSAKCGTSIPDRIARRFSDLRDTPEHGGLVGMNIAREQVINLIGRGLTDFHFYTMNRSDPTYAICRILGIGRAEFEKTDT
jgi:methylenetetrahydrofolate reductase (NADPH)